MAPVYPSPPSSPLGVQSPNAHKGDIKHGFLDDRTSRTTSSGDSSYPIGSSLSKPPNLTNHSKQETGRPTETVDPTALKRRLSISNWRCGFPKKPDEPCKNWVLKSNRPEVDLKIKSIANLVQSSPELANELKDLAKLVHCRFHNKIHAIDSRAKQWLAVFPSGGQDIDPGIYLEREMREALGPLSTQCTGEIITQGSCSASNTEQERCSFKVGGQKVYNCIRTIEKIISLVRHFEDAMEVEYLLKVLERNRQCEDHNESPLEHTGVWNSRILDIQSKYRPLLENWTNNDPAKPFCDTPGTPDPENGRRPLHANETKARHQNQDMHGLSDSQFPLSWLDIEPAEYWLSAFDVSTFDNIERKPNLSGPQSSVAGILKRAGSDLNVAAGDLKDGHIYLYQVEGNEKYVKIGYTTREVHIRNKEWEFACNRVPKMLYPEPSATKRVPNVRRVEALCHKELDHCPVNVYCRVCLQDHNEWFEIAAADAEKVIQKWSIWMATNPYEKKELRSETKWVLKVDQQKKLLDIISN